MTGETCDGGVCKCGTGVSCANQITGAFCDTGNSVCKCAEAVDACTDGEICTEGACGMKFINNRYTHFTIIHLKYLALSKKSVYLKHFY